MCPGTLAIIAAGTAAAGSLLKGVTSAESASYQAQVARNNATISRQNAAYSAGAAEVDTERAGLEARAHSASVRAALAANNVDVNSGSPADVQASERVKGALDTATVANRGAQKVYGYEGQATSFQSEANLKQSEVIPDLLMGGLGAVSSVAGGAADYGSANPAGGNDASGSQWASNFPSTVNGIGVGGSPSLIEASPSVGSDYQWMIGSGSSDPYAQQFGG
jgi:hypothetical protein